MSKGFLTPRFALVALLGAVPAALLTAFVGVPALIALGGWATACAVLAAVDASLAPSPKQVAVSRRAPARATRDEPLQLLVELQNLGEREVRGAAWDTWPESAASKPSAYSGAGGGGSSRWAAFAAAPGERVRIGFTLSPRRRGTMRSGFIAVRASGPLGLAGKAFWHPLPTEISVSRSPRRRQLAVQAAPDEARLVAALLQESTDKNTETVMRAVEELRMLAAVYGGGRTRAAQGGLPLADKINDYLPKIGSGRSDRSGRLIPLLDHLSDLFVRAQQHGDPQQRRLLLSRYADTLTKLASLLSENYYGDILRNPGYWSDPEQRLSQVLNAVAAVDQEVLENIRQLSESRDIEFKVALESLTRPQNGAKLSDVYHDRSP